MILQFQYFHTTFTTDYFFSEKVLNNNLSKTKTHYKRRIISILLQTVLLYGYKMQGDQNMNLARVC